MFKSIEYRLYLYIFLLITFVGLSTYFFFTAQYVYGGFSLFMIFVSLNRLYVNYNKFNKNILFLLNALDNGDYSFNFTETKISRREKELNKMMNRIKEILSNARQEVIEKEKFMSVIIENVPTGIIILDEKNNIKNINKETSRVLGMPILTHLNQLSVIDKGFPDLFRSLQVDDDNTQIKVINEKEIAQISLSVSQIKIHKETLRIITLNNIGNELDTREMESWIKLIRVMTHEIMNSIAPITSLTEMLLFSYKTSEEAIKSQDLRRTTIDSLSTINSTAKDLSTFVESYRQFSGVAQPVLTPIEVLPFIHSIINLEKAEIEANDAAISVSTTEDILVILGDRTQLTRVIVNLIKNALEALGNIEDRRIKITIQSEGKSKVQINVCNNGAPISPDILDNIFIPFFTTKESGSGIGLSVSRYILRQHDGNLKHIYENGWTIFSLTLNRTKCENSHI